MDLSLPKDTSVNASVQKDIYLGTQYVLNYPSIDLIISSLCNLGPAAKIYKVDISRAFRQIKIDPMDIDLLGLKFQDQYFIDKSVPFRYHNGSQIFQKCTDAIRFTMQQHGFPHLFTVATLCNAHAFESAHPQSYIIAHKLLICRFEVNFLHINQIIGEM